MTSECATSRRFKVLRKFEKAVAFVCRFLCGLKLLLGSSDGVIALNNGYDQTARSDFRSRPYGGSGSRGATKIRNTGEVQNLMHVTLADVFMHGIVGDVANALPAIALGIEILRVVVHAGEQCVARQALVPAGKPGVGQCGLKLRAVLPGPRKSIFQRQAERWRCCWRSLLRIFLGAVLAGAGASCATAIRAQHNKTAATGVHDSTRMTCDFMNLDSWAGRMQVHGKEESNVTKRR